MDVTITFHDCLKSIQMQNKALAQISAYESKNGHKSVNNDWTSSDTRDKLKLNKDVSKFGVKASELVSAISKMKHFLTKHGKDYINMHSPLLSQSSTMSDSERDQIDSDMHQFMMICNNAIKVLKSDVNQKKSSQLTSHQNCVINLMEHYFKQVCNIHSEQKAIRINRSLEKLKLMKLEGTACNDKIEGHEDDHSRDISQDRRKKNGFDKQKHEPSDISETNERHSNLNEDAHQTYPEVENEPKIELTAAELQLLKEENEMLYEEMNSMRDDVRNIEGRVIEIARLQEIFTSKVLQQEHDMNRVNETVIASTETIRGGNEQLREAMRKNAGFRIWVLFFIITLAFTILFLDWYNW